jgi:hypothetical protein
MDLVSVFCREILVFPETFVEKVVFFPLYISGAFAKN